MHRHTEILEKLSTFPPSLHREKELHCSLVMPNTRLPVKTMTKAQEGSPSLVKNLWLQEERN